MKQLYCIPKQEEINKFLDFSNKYNAGFEYNDFFLPAVLDNPNMVKSLIEFYKSLPRDRSEDTLHGVFLDICIHSSDSLIYKASDYRIHQSMDIARELGVKAVIFHTNHIPNFKLQNYMENWVNMNVTYWKNLLSEYPDLNIYIENMFDFDSALLLELAKRMSDEDRFGVCLDFAHAHISAEPISEWCKNLAPYVKHVHINDNHGEEDTHNPIGKGTLPWDMYCQLTNGCPGDALPSVLIEVRNYDDLVKSVEYMKANKMYPF